MLLPSKVKLVEVAPRDGLQNESAILPVSVRIELINRLSQCGFKTIEVGSFVSPKIIPQLNNTDEVLRRIDKIPNVYYSVLVPNLQGFQKALDSKVSEIAIFGAASEAFSKNNINCTRQESLSRFSKIIPLAINNNIRVRGYISCAFGCPYEGYVDIEQVAYMVEQLYKIGCYEIALGDTIGAGTPKTVTALIERLTKNVPSEVLAFHFHDTFGLAITNIYVCLGYGISTFDCSIAGLGGCPYAKGTGGNVASEDLVHFLNGLNIQTGIDLSKLLTVSQYISDILKKPHLTKVASALS